MFKKSELTNYRNPIERIFMKTLVYGDKTLLAEFKLQKGAILPRHKHLHEQTGYLISGCIDLTIGDVTHRTMPGDSWSIPGNVEHNAVAHEDSVAVEVFSPVREDYIP